MLFFLKSRFTIDPDFGWHITSGRYIFEHGIPKTDIFTYTAAGFPWIHHEWLADVANFLIYNFTGYTGLSVVYAVLSAAAFWLVAAPYRYKTLLVLAALVALPFAGVRAAAWTVFLLALLMVVMRQSKKVRWVWALPLMLLWANMHGSFIVGLVYLGFCWLKHQSWHTFLLLLVACMVTLINPYGTELYTEVFRTAGDTALHSRIGEWESFQLEIGLGILVGLWVVARAVAGKQSSWQAFVHFDTVTLLLVLSASRHIPLFALASLPVILQSMGRSSSFWKLLDDKRIAGLGITVVALAVTTLAYDGLQHIRLDPESAYPRVAAQSLVTRPCTGNLFNDYNDGGYLIWRAPNQKVFIDGRMPSWRLNGKDYFAEYERIIKDEQYRKEQFNAFRISCFLGAEKGSITKHLIDDGWQTRVKDNGYMLLERQLPR